MAASSILASLRVRGKCRQSLQERRKRPEALEKEDQPHGENAASTEALTLQRGVRQGPGLRVFQAIDCN